MNYHYKIIISGEEPAGFGTPEDNLAKCIDLLEPKPSLVYLRKALHRPLRAAAGEPAGMTLDKPVSLLRLGELMRCLSATEDVRDKDRDIGNKIQKFSNAATNAESRMTLSELRPEASR